MTAWRTDWNELAERDPAGLDATELQRLATAAFLLGRYQESVAAWDRAHSLLLDDGDAAGACRCLFWLLLAIGEDDVKAAARMGGELARIQRLVDEHALADLERSYLACYAAIDKFMSGEYSGGIELWRQVSDIGRTHGDGDIWAFGAQGLGRSLICAGRVGEGSALLDELFVAITAGELSPMMTGWVYCSCLLGCHEAFDMARAVEWTTSANSWADSQPDLETYTGVCLVHRSRIRRMQGLWKEALQDIDAAVAQLSDRRKHWELGEAHYNRGELLRAQGDREGADASYRLASQHGHDPQPGLALLRLAQGKTAAARSALRRALDETSDIKRRAELLPAMAEVALLEADLGTAESVCAELEQLTETFSSLLLSAESRFARGRIRLAEGDARAALDPLRNAHRLWQELEMPIAEARARVHLANACDALGDTDGAELERHSAREVFERFGAVDELAVSGVRGRPQTPLTERESEVVRKVAAGLSNRAVSTQLHISEKTVASHLSHIFTKLDVGNRAGVTAYYYEHLAGNR